MYYGLLLFILLCVSSFLEAAELTDDQRFTPFAGEVLPTRTATDTLSIKIDLICRIGLADSISMCLTEDHYRSPDSARPSFATGGETKDSVAIVYRRTEAVIPRFPITVIQDDNSIRISGTVGVSLNGANARDFDLELRAYLDDQKYDIRSNIWLNPEGMRGTLLIPSIGFYDSRLAGELKKNGIFLGLTLGIEWNKLHYTLALETSWSGIGKKFSFSNPLRGSGQFFPFNRNRFSPFIEVGGGLSKIKVEEEGFEYRKVKWGGDFGGGVTTAFDRVSYNYSTGEDGFHTVELFLGAASLEEVGRYGTLCRCRFNRKIWTIEIMGYVSGINDHGLLVSRDSDGRPKPLRWLAEVGLLPLKILMRGLDN